MRPIPVKLSTFFLCVCLIVGLPGRSFSQKSQAQGPSGAAYELGFSPGSALSVVLHGISLTKESIYVACYEFTSRPIADALVAAFNRGVKVAIVADYKASLDCYSLIPYLAKSGIPLRRDSRYQILHDKFLVINAVDVETGSFNYTSAASTLNAGNVLILYNAPDISQAYLREWQRLWAESR
jgi:phosphatidylserine/phosphatidylglycerophosphate/cardiolipin synthase-like enzyme